MSNVISFDEFQINKPVRTINYGTIYIAYWKKKKSQEVALKYLSETEVDINDILKEVREIKEKTHENVTKILGVTKDEEKQAVVIVLQKTDSNLREYLKGKTDDKSLELRDKLKLAYEISSGLNFLHLSGYVHRNLAVIMDPRLSIILNETQPLNTLKNTIPYVAPEILENINNIPNFKSDVYSLGVIFWEISSGHEPFQNYDGMTLIQSIINNNKRGSPEDIPNDYVGLYTKCLDSNPDLRPNTQNICLKLNDMLKENLK
ncbi:6366_t:CDS:2, partial [Acaulospora colombiana]